MFERHYFDKMNKNAQASAPKEDLTPLTKMLRKPRSDVLVKGVPNKNLLIIPFAKGKIIYDDHNIFYGRQFTDNVFRLIVDYCNFDHVTYINSVERMANLDPNNPDGKEGVSDLMIHFAMEFYLLARQEKLFFESFTKLNGFAYEYFGFRGDSIILQEKT